MKTKKSVFFAALAAVLLISTLLITNCVNPIIPVNIETSESDDYTPSPGMGYIRLNVSASARNILPDVTDISDFTSFKLLVYADTNGNGVWDGSVTDQQLAVPGNGEITITNLSAPIEFPIGNYWFDLSAFHDSTVVAASATPTAIGLITIDSNSNQTKNVTLTNVAMSGTGKGRFSLAFNFPSHGLNKADLKIIPLAASGGDASHATAAPLTHGTAVTGNLDAGYYRVEVDMEQDEYQSRKYGHVEVLRIWEGMASSATRTLPTLNKNVYDITFTYADGRSSDNTTVKVTHGVDYSAFVGSGGAANAHSPDNASNVHFGTSVDLTGWSLTAGGTALDNSHIFIKAQTLHALWYTSPSFVLQITYTAPLAPNAPVIEHDAGNNGLTFNQGSGTSIEFSLTNISDFTDVTWYFNGAETNSDTLTIDFSDTEYLVVGEYTLYVIAEHNTDGPVDATDNPLVITVTAAP